MKHANEAENTLPKDQPPSGGCVLKLVTNGYNVEILGPAAFRRLCVETRKQAQSLLAVGSSRLQAAVC